MWCIDLALDDSQTAQRHNDNAAWGGGKHTTMRVYVYA